MKPFPKLHHLHAGDRQGLRKTALIPAGIPALEALLPGGGWPKRGLVEVLVPDGYSDALSLFIPALVRLGDEGRWLGTVVPSYAARQRLLTAPPLGAARILQINPHKGRSVLWTLESLLRSGNFSAVMAWTGGMTQLMAKRLERAARIGHGLGILFREDSQTPGAPGIGLRLRLEGVGAARAVYLLDKEGKRLAGSAVC